MIPPTLVEASPGAPASGDVAGGRVLAGRYRLEKLLGQGGQGEVWSAIDLAVSLRVAVKLLHPGAADESARVRREAGALRLVRVPGVVRLLDEGLDEDRTFLVLDLVEGRPFPGGPGPVAWSELAPIATALLETLARVHAAGVIHRDLKPANVLVTADGRPVILDFGLSRLATPRGDDLTAAGQILGTPAYLAPEQIRGGPVTARTDLYAVGALLYEALAGRLPHEASDWMTMLRVKLTRTPVPLKEAAPDVPLAVARAIDLLLSVAAEDRPASAADALRRLAGDTAPPGPELPWLGSPEDIEVAASALLAGRSLDVVAEPGEGCSRFVREVQSRLVAAGRRPATLTPSNRPFASLEPAIGPVISSPEARLEEVAAERRERARDFLSTGGALLSDDGAALDPWSSRVLRDVHVTGGVLVVFKPPGPPGALRKRPLEEADLRALFAGPDRLFHLREDAARLLWQRTGGRPRRIVDELGGWVRAGIARPEGAKYRVDRDALDAHEEGLLVALPPAPDRVSVAALPPHLVDLATWISLAERHATPMLLSTLVRQPRWRVEAEVEELLSRRVARPSEASPEAVVLQEPLEPTHLWPLDRVRAAHRSLAAALPPGAPRRIMHLLMSHTAPPKEVAEEALAAGRRLFEEGKTGRAAAVLEEGVRALRAGDGGPTELLESLFVLWLEVATADVAPRAADRILYELGRIQATTILLDRLGLLARAQVALSTEPARASSIADSLPGFDLPAVERVRQGILVTGSRAASAARESEALERAAVWAGATNDPDSLAALETWRGRYCYRIGEFDKAAEHHLRAAERARSSARIAAQLNAASSLIEAFRAGQAADIAADAGVAARRCLNVYLEARAEWLVRAAKYRLEQDGAVDVDLVEAVSTLGVAHLEAPVCLTEATFAWRAGDRSLARDLALRAERIWSRARIHQDLSLLARLLAAVCGEPATPEEAATFEQRALSCVVQGVGVQAIGLMRMGGFEIHLSPAAWSGLLAVTRTLPQSVRMDVLSLEESCTPVSTLC